MTEEKSVSGVVDDNTNEQKPGVVIDDSRIGSKNAGTTEKYHKLCCRKAEIIDQIECSDCPDKKTSLTLELDSITRRITGFYDFSSH